MHCEASSARCCCDLKCIESRGRVSRAVDFRARVPRPVLWPSTAQDICAELCLPGLMVCAKVWASPTVQLCRISPDAVLGYALGKTSDISAPSVYS